MPEKQKRINVEMVPNPQVGCLIMALRPVIMPVQTKSNFHPLGEKTESRETRNKGYPQGFQLINLWIWVQAVDLTHTPFVILDQHVEIKSGHVSIGTMHLAKGLEFKMVAVMACDEEILPLSSRIADIGDDSDLKEVYDTERHLFYVACTRAREGLLITGIKPGSEFIEDMRPQY